MSHSEEIRLLLSQARNHNGRGNLERAIQQLGIAVELLTKAVYEINATDVCTDCELPTPQTNATYLKPINDTSTILKELVQGSEEEYQIEPETEASNDVFWKVHTPERNIFAVDTGSVSPNDARTLVDQIRDDIKETSIAKASVNSAEPENPLEVDVVITDAPADLPTGDYTQPLDEPVVELATPTDGGVEDEELSDAKITKRRGKAPKA